MNRPMYPGAMTPNEFIHYYCRKLGALIASALLVATTMVALFTILFW